MCIVPTDTSDCTHVMHPGASAAGNDGYGGINRGRDQTRAPAAWTRSSLNSIGTSNNATGGASGGRTPVPKTPRRSKRSIPPTTDAKIVEIPGTGRSRKKRRRRKRSDAEEEEDCHRVGRLIRIAVDESGEPLTAGQICPDRRTNLLWEAGIITHVILVNHRKLYVVHKGTFKCWFSANETLAKNEREKIPNPHFPDYLDIKELEELGLVEYLDLNIWPHPRDLDAAEEPVPVPPESNGLIALAAIAVDTDTEEGPIAPRHTPRPERRHIRFVVNEGEDATAELLGSELGSMDITEQQSPEPPSPMPPALPRTEPDAAWTQAMNIANELRGGSVSMDTLKEDIVQRHQETSSPAPPPTQSTPIVSIYPIDESPNDDAGPRSVTPARLRQDTPSTILGGMGRLAGGHDLFGNLPGGEFPMDDDEDDVDAPEHGGEGEAAAAGGTQREEPPPTGDEGPESDYEHVEPPRDDEANDNTAGDGDGDGDEEEDADEEPGEDDEGAVAVLAAVMTPEADDAAALLAKAVGALIAKIESNTATRTSLVTRADAIDAQNEELGRTIEVMTATIDTLRGQN